MSIDEGRLDKALKNLGNQDAELAQSIAAVAAVVSLIPGVEKIDTNLAANIARALSGHSTSDRSRQIISEIVRMAKGAARDRDKT